MIRRPAQFLRRSRSRAAVAAACVLLAIAGPTAYAAPAADPAPPPGTIGAPPAAEASTATVSWGIGPTPEGPEPGTTRPSFFLVAEPGSTIKDSIRLRNLGDEEIKLRLYSTDALNTFSGAQDLLPATEQPKDIGTWIELEQDEVTLDGLQYIDVPFTLKVPVSAEPGDHTGGIVSTMAVAEDDDSGTAINLDRRLASRVALRVDGALSPGLTISDFSAGYSGTPNPAGRGSTDLNYRLTNTGNVRLSAQQIVKVKGPLGLVARTATLNPIPELLPGASIIVASSVSGVWPTLRTSASLEIRPFPTREGDEFPALASARAGASGWAVPWALIVLLLAAGGLSGGTLLMRNQTKQRQQQRVEAAVQADRATRPDLAGARPDSSL